MQRLSEVLGVLFGGAPSRENVSQGSGHGDVHLIWLELDPHRVLKIGMSVCQAARNREETGTCHCAQQPAAPGS
jgi:hypothetical protein